MELKLVIHRKTGPVDGYFDRVVFTEDDLLEWAESWVEDRFSNSEVISVDVDSIVP